MNLTIPIRTVSEANQSKFEHWGTKQRRAKKQRETVALMMSDWGFRAAVQQHRELLAAGQSRIVRLRRVAPRELDGDNLQRSFKAIRDEVAKQLGVDDRDKRVTWEYHQRKGNKPKEYAIEISIECVS